MSRYNKDEYFNLNNFCQVVRKATPYGMFKVGDVIYLSAWDSLASIDKLVEIGRIELMIAGDMSQNDVYGWT